jgi:hypothetical protein
MENMGVKKYLSLSSSSKEKIKKDTSEEASWKLNSHMEALSQSLYSNSEWTFICEDAVLVEYPVKLEEILKDVPEDWDVLYLGEMNHYHSPEHINTKILKCVYSFNTIGYIIKHSFIPKVVTRLLRRDEEHDVIFAKMQEEGIGNWYCLANPIIGFSHTEIERMIK